MTTTNLTRLDWLFRIAVTAAFFGCCLWMTGCEQSKPQPWIRIEPCTFEKWKPDNAEFCVKLRNHYRGHEMESGTHECKTLAEAMDWADVCLTEDDYWESAVVTNGRLHEWVDGSAIPSVLADHNWICQRPRGGGWVHRSRTAPNQTATELAIAGVK